MAFKSVVNLCLKHGFFRLKGGEKEAYGLGPTGFLLLENLRREWHKNVVVNSKDMSVFVSDASLEASFEFAKSMCLEQPPFGLAEVVDAKSDDSSAEKFKFSGFFDQDKVFNTWMFVNPVNSMQFFHEWQRQRRMWWSKFSASPGRYKLTDIKTVVGNTHSVEIVAKYSWGDELIETITLNPLANRLKNNANNFELKDGKKSIQAHCVLSETKQSIMVLNTVCDAFDQPLFEQKPRPLLRLHQKLAPYKISFAISTSSSTTMAQELLDLGEYLCRQLRMNHVSCLLLPSSYKNTLDAQWRQYDQLGVPYNVLLNESTLKNGIIYLRSRETTLKEQLHIADLNNYVDKLYRNY